MPNALAYLVLFSFPLVVAALFWKLPAPKALVASILGGYLFLPTGVTIDLPVLPALDKTLIPGLVAAIMCLIVARRPASRLRPDPARMSGSVSGPVSGPASGPVSGRAARPHRAAAWTPERAPERLETSASAEGAAPALQRTSRGRMLFRTLFVVLFSVPLLTVYQNPDPIIAGPTFIPGLRLYDMGSLMMQLGVTFLPFVLAQRFLAQPEDQVMLLRALVISALAYSVLCLYEIRLSPQLNHMLYGFYQNDFLQHIRAGGFRPMVFLLHGLWVGLYLAMAVLAAATLFLWSKRNGKQGLSVFGWAATVLWLLLVLFLSKTVGAFSLVLLFLPVLLIAGVQGHLLFAMIIAGIALFYPLLRGAGWIPVDTVYAVSQSISQERADSLKYRLDNEDALLERAAEKPLAGWGSWGRNLIYDPYSGQQTSIPDGAWIIIIGAFGWVGYLSHFGLLTAPLFLLGISRRKLGVTVEASGLAMVLAINLMDLVPNATLTPVTYLIAGALCGRYALAGAPQPEAAATGSVTGSVTGVRPLRAPSAGRAAWPTPPLGPPQTPARTAEIRLADSIKYRRPRQRPE